MWGRVVVVSARNESVPVGRHHQCHMTKEFSRYIHAHAHTHTYIIMTWVVTSGFISSFTLTMCCVRLCSLRV